MSPEWKILYRSLPISGAVHFQSFDPSATFMAFVEHLVETYGLVVVAGVILLESLGLPMPGETVLIVASIYAGASHPHLYIIDVVLTAAGAGLVGQMIGYVIGRELGYWLLLRYGAYVRITESRTSSANTFSSATAARSSSFPASSRCCAASPAFWPEPTACRGDRFCSAVPPERSSGQLSSALPPTCWAPSRTPGRPDRGGRRHRPVLVAGRLRDKREPFRRRPSARSLAR